jgi:hypothetical protein
MGDGKVRDLPGGVEQYLELRHAALSHANVQLATPKAALTEHLHEPATGVGAGTGATAAQLREARKDMARIEKQLARLAEREERLHVAMAEAATDHTRVAELNGQLREVADERDALELQWLEAAEVVG